jgi:hypothetical protein
MQGGSIQKTVVPTPYSPAQQADIDRSQVTSGLLVILIPIVIVCAIMGDRTHKAKVLQQRIHRLNRIWQLDSSKKLS